MMKTFHIIVEGEDSGYGEARIPELDLRVTDEYSGACGALEKLGERLDIAGGAAAAHLWQNDPEAFQFCDSQRLVIAQKLIEMFGKKMPNGTSE